MHVYTCICLLLSRSVTESNSFTDSDQFNIRWFSPSCEVNLCGHGTVAAAQILSQIYNNTNNTVYYNSLSGQLKTVMNPTNGVVDLCIPAYGCELVPERDEVVREIVELTVGDQLPVASCYYSDAALKLLIRLKDGVSRSQLEGLRLPDMKALLGINQDKVKGVIVTLKAGEDGRGYDFFSRYFTPWYGSPEDYVTG